MFYIRARLWLILYFIAFLFIWGIFLPFWGIWLEGQGISSSDIGLLFSAGLLLRFLSNLTLLPRISSGISLLRLLRFLGLLTFIAFTLLFYLQGDLWLAIITLCVNFFMAPMMPLGDVIGSRLVKQINLDYGRVRLWGSLAFIAGSTCVGWLIVEYGQQAILWLIVCATLLLYLLSLLNLSPQLAENDPSETPLSGSLLALFKRRDVILFLIITGAIQGSHGAYYAFSSIYWSHSGISETNIAYLWALGVFAEVLVMRFNSKLFNRWSIKQMLLLGLVASILRWLMVAISSDLYLLGLSQTLHAFTFAVTHLAAIRYIGLQENKEMMRYQSLYSAVALGLILALFTYISGAFFESLQGDIFLLTSLLLMPIFWCIKIWKIDERAVKR
ncbi:3-phenylpropionate MFS transporter [Psychromonas antarctica]|uniref:3-phenylpropionate MFS transporter n=1 Tax=Psychromonas antarctica TaxID=67573 RepID=UPI001EE8AE24|nr:3-phenylpropionate MFS transporter [Psychromonas antarctica]MCG6202784.1 3-phenylpropionate MFS transporter [Psychromonas antarctica]